MIQVSKEEFIEMFRLGILDGKDKYRKSWNITSRNKKSKRKKRFISEYEYGKYQKAKVDA